MSNTRVHFSSLRDDWATPRGLFDLLDKEFAFDLDPAANGVNAKCARFFTREVDGLSQSWRGARVFCNPPYGRVIGQWVKRFAEGEADVVVALLPARTDARWFHEHILGKAEVRFIRGRIQFEGGKWSAPFPCMVCVWAREVRPGCHSWDLPVEVRYA